MSVGLQLDRLGRLDRPVADQYLTICLIGSGVVNHKKKLTRGTAKFSVVWGVAVRTVTSSASTVFRMSSATQTRIAEVEAQVKAIRQEMAPMTAMEALQQEVIRLKEQIAGQAEQLAKKGPGRPKKEKAPEGEDKGEVKKEKKAKPAKAEVEPQGEAPDLDIYKLQVPINPDLCMARLIADPDARWTKAVYHEKQCSKKPVDDEPFCALCAGRLVKYLDKPDWKSGWNGRIDEDPADDESLTKSVHMPGTAWFADVTWTGTSKSKSKSASPEAQAEKAEKKALKEAEKEAKKEAKEAEKATKKPKEPKEAKKPKEAKEVKATGGALPAIAETAEPVDGGYLMCLIDGELRVHKNGNVYELNEVTQEPGDYLGRLTGTIENPGLDCDADEVLETEVLE